MIIVYTESEEGKFKKIALEAVSYAKGIAENARHNRNCCFN